MEHLVTYQPNESKRRLGSESDGGYVIIEGYAYDAYISCGISTETSFDEAFVRYHPGIPGFAYDGTVDRPHTLPGTIEFFKTNIGPENSETTTNLTHLTAIYKEIFLKMDIEGHEWKWIMSMPNAYMTTFKQIVIEVHGLWDDNWEASIDVKKSALRKLAQTHNLVHAHGNNHAAFADIPTVLELTYLRKDIPVAGLNSQPFPQSVDRPNCPGRADYVLNTWPFVTP